MVHPGKFLIMALLAGITFLILFATHVAMPFSIVSASSATEAKSAPIQAITEKPVSQSDRTESTTCGISNSYPQEVHVWCGLIQFSAEKYQLDANLLAAVILQESGGQADAYSSSGAVGLMQVMPRDGIATNYQCVNGPCFSNRPSMNELFDPAFNIEFGSKMLTNLFNRHGNWRDALKAYGPMDVGYQYADLVMSIYQNYQ